MPIVAKRRQLPAFPAGDDQIILTIAIQITPCDPRPQLTQPLGQQGLPLEIVSGSGSDTGSVIAVPSRTLVMDKN